MVLIDLLLGLAELESHCYSSVETFSLAVDTANIGRVHHMHDVGTDSIHCKEFGYKMQSTVRQIVTHNSVLHDQILSNLVAAVVDAPVSTNMAMVDSI